MVKGISRQVIVVHSPDPKLFEQAIFILKDRAVDGEGISDEALLALAVSARERSYSPYSGYKVGAALLCADGTVYQGCNIENAAYGPTNCAERTAFFKAVYDGHRDFVSIAVCGGKDGIISSL